MQHNLQRVRWAIAISAAALATSSQFLLGLTPAVAQRNHSVVPAGVGADSGDTSSSGVRGQCIKSTAGLPSLTALLPQTAAATLPLGQTAAAYPTLWVYVPETTAEWANFLLVDAQGAEVYNLDFELTEQSGLIELPLNRMEDMPALEPNQRYEWSFSLVCDPIDSSGNLVTEGELERIELPSEQLEKLATLTPMQQALLYAELGI
ncbi:MAG: DUF928 domain-containing protein, partial [Spirulinaceae cyanobacterium RM2_2_10]|nr:DUF928 domain-containing protein [Spirulinaceae cyanobacterium RM2_2_10]